MPTVIDATVVNQAYDTSGNGGRKLVRLSNGWLVAGVWDSTNNRVVFYKSEDNGQTWSQLCYLTISGIGNNFSLSSKGTNVYIVYGTNYAPFYIYQHRFDALTVANTNIESGSSTLHYLGSTSGNVQGVSTVINGNEIHATWSAKVDGYKNSNNIFYVKGTINANGSVTWSSVQQLTNQNNTQVNLQNPSIVVDSNNIPYIFFEHSYANNNRISLLTKKFTTKQVGYGNLSDWGDKEVYFGGSYAQANPCACVDKNGRIWVAWHGKDATDSSFYNIRVAYSDDGGVTWSTSQKLTSSSIVGGSYDQLHASITVNKNNEVFIVWYGRDSSDSYTDIRMIKYSNGSWGSPSIVSQAPSGTNHKQYPSTLYDIKLRFSTPLFIYQDQQNNKVGFYGTWSTTEISVPPGFIGQKTSADKNNLLTYSITTEETMGTITEKINGTVINTRSNPTSGQQFMVSLSQAQWDALKFTNGHTLTIEMNGETWTYTFDKRLHANDDILSAVKGVQDLQNHLNIIKSQLAAAIRAKGGTVNDTDPFSAFVSTVANMQAKKWAAGTVTSTPMSDTLQFILGNNTTSTWSYITVTGLTFKPSVIIARYKPTAYTTGIQIIYDSRGMIADYDVKIALGYVPYNGSSQPTYGFKEDGTKAYVNSDGFRLPASNDKTYEWIAFE